ncbi:hypothetical protein ZRA01_15290 [Zoogloea ramigera]|uniref:DUF3348 domain-containing protein n=1 Tax=Zoogloea ramigera TaxID=350 RepID=A0A4Y4CT00_ZOORA|nr:DUF3348 domain-containing protein [Zoogloea ramigera]GEC95456.1 hypothetical protein ZRA01_15290 [Zoogloea ramigera]
MARGSPRTSFDSSRLIRALSDLVSTDAAPPRQSFADRLGQWLDFADAIALFSALNGSTDAAGGPATAEHPALRDEFARVRGALLDSINTDGVLTPGKARIRLPAPAWHASTPGAADYLPYHRYYLAHQRDMGAAIAPLRASVRAGLAQRAPALRQLAALDGVLDQALAPRERSLLATVPQLLGRHFEQLHQAHRSALPTPDDPARWLQPGAWLHTFCQDMRAVLLAELELRLQPVAGLMDALNEVTRQP